MKMEDQEQKLIRHGNSKEKKPSSEAIMTLASLAINFNVSLKSSDMDAHMQEHALRYTRSLIPLHPASSKHINTTHLARALKKVYMICYSSSYYLINMYENN